MLVSILLFQSGALKLILEAKTNVQTVVGGDNSHTTIYMPVLFLTFAALEEFFFDDSAGLCKKTRMWAGK